MAMQSRMQLIPSTGILIGAIAAGIAAAFLVNLYIAGVKSEYTEGAIEIYVLKEPLEEGQPLLEKHLKTVRIPSVFEEAFKGALKPIDKGLLKDQTAPRKMGAGQPIFYGDLYDVGIMELPVIVGRGYDLVTIPIETRSASGLQPGGYVRIYAVFDDDPDPRKELLMIRDVLRNVQVRAVDGSTRPIPADKRARYDTISILVTEDQALKIRQLQQVMSQKEFTIDLSLIHI